MRKSVLLAAALVLMLGSIALAADGDPHAKGEAPALPPGPKVSGDVYLGVMNKYMFRGNQLNAKNSFVTQGGMDLTYNSFTFSYWFNNQNRDTGYAKAKTTENDAIINYAVPELVKDVTLNVGAQYYSLDAAEDTAEFYLRATYNTLLSPTLGIYWDFLEARNDGLFYTASVTQPVPLVQDKLTLNLGALVSYNQHNPSAAYTDTDSRSGIYSDWHNYEVSATVDYKLFDNVTITPSYTFSDHLSSHAKNVGIGAKNCYGLKAMLSF
ncbi:hypothetical protein [Geomonas agri]|uniref:hypothetical protein n=1 Tax=Geomonas agri TaxID=2873702 RepID=UPI001CD7E718|nr:hypothetical protein [Geomonas agri]